MCQCSGFEIKGYCKLFILVMSVLFLRTGSSVHFKEGDLIIMKLKLKNSSSGGKLCDYM